MGKMQRAGNHHTLLTRRQRGQTAWGNICCVLNGEEQMEHVTVYNPVILLLSLSFLKQRRIANLHEARVLNICTSVIPNSHDTTVHQLTSRINISSHARQRHTM